MRRDIFDEIFRKLEGGFGDDFDFLCKSAPLGQVPYNTMTQGAEGSMVITLDLPGVTPEGLEVRTENGKLFIKGTRADQTTIYRKAFSINHPLSIEGITAKLAHGVLTITVPAAVKTSGQKIEVQVG
jgi:HSP20 family molecular chaperone IbpA